MKRMKQTVQPVAVRLRRGDTVRVMTGKDAGRTGQIERVLPSRGRLVIAGVNMVKRHLKATPTRPQQGIIDQAMPIHASNVQLVCPSCKKPTRIGVRFEGEEKLRVCRKCQATISAGAQLVTPKVKRVVKKVEKTDKPAEATVKGGTS